MESNDNWFQPPRRDPVQKNPTPWWRDWWVKWGAMGLGAGVGGYIGFLLGFFVGGLKQTILAPVATFDVFPVCPYTFYTVLILSVILFGRLGYMLGSWWCEERTCRANQLANNPFVLGIDPHQLN